MPVEPLAPSALRRVVPPDSFSFATTASLDGVRGPVGQERAREAMRLGVSMPGEGYNLFVTGWPGVGRHSLVRELLESHAKDRPVPRDVCYVRDFGRPERPRALLLPAGRGAELRDDLAQLVTELRTVLPSAFDSDEFRRGKQRIEEEYKKKHEARLEKLRASSEARHVAILPTPSGFAIAPIHEGNVLEPQEFEKLPAEERARFDEAMEATKEELREMLEEVPRLQKFMRAAMRELVRATATRAVRQHVEDVKQAWADEPTVLAHLEAFERDVCENVEDFIKQEEGSEPSLPEVLRERPLRRYEVNVLVDHASTQRAPVVYENHPTHANLMGRIEHVQQLGALVTDFNLIKPGAIHRANGGYLMLDARELLSQPFAWEALKRALLSREVRIESPAQSYGLVSTVSLEPEPIPLAVKVVLIGERQIHELLERFDPDFRALFKIVADFDDEIARTNESVLRYADLLASVANAEGLAPLDRGAVARVLEELMRLAGDTGKLSARVLDAFDLVREASFVARERGAEVTSAEHVEAAVRAQERRSARVRERVLEAIEEGTVAIATDGRCVGQVNGLSVAQVGRSAFGRPSRITATVRLGRGEVVDIEREVDLGGPIHSKGVLILASYLGSHFAPESPLSLHASLVFEQSYGPIDGDSASCAELCALLSSLADVPLRQSIAVTGSVNQHGEVQAIGGVNEKIEGFFDVCRARGLQAGQGVVIPKANVRHLMLRDEVVKAVEAGTFHVWAVGHVDEVMELLGEIPAGARGPLGKFPEGSLNARVEARLVELAERRLALDHAKH